MTEQSDRIIVIGAGHNGLVCAAYLARAGRPVTVLEAAADIGGGAGTREFSPGFSVSGCAHLLHSLHPRVVADLALEPLLDFAATDLDTIALARDGDHLRIGATTVSGAGICAADQTAYTQFRKTMGRFAGVLERAYRARPPRLANGGAADTAQLARLGLRVRRLGQADMREFLRILGINIYDVLNDTFDHELLQGALALDAVLGTHMGPRTPNTVMTYLHRLAVGNGRLALPRNGMGSLARALAGVAADAGADVRTATPVKRILVDDGVVRGVVLDSGERLAAKTVVSSADPKRTFFELLGARHLEAGFARRVNNIRMRGNAAKLHLALDRLPAFAGLSGPDLGARLLIAPDPGYVERAFDPAKYGEHSREPVIELILPSVHDQGVAPPDQHVLSAVVQYAPYSLRSGWASAQEGFAALVIDTISAYAPDIREHIVATELLTPPDLEREYRLTGGHWHHGELALDQFMMLRPVPGAAQYAAPLSGLYLCGAGTHPGGGVMGLGGCNAAREVLAQENGS